MIVSIPKAHPPDIYSLAPSGALSAIVLFLAGSMEIFEILVEYTKFSSSHLTHEEILIGVIGVGVFFMGKNHRSPFFLSRSGEGIGFISDADH